MTATADPSKHIFQMNRLDQRASPGNLSPIGKYKPCIDYLPRSSRPGLLLRGLISARHRIGHKNNQIFSTAHMTTHQALAFSPMGGLDHWRLRTSTSIWESSATGGPLQENTTFILATVDCSLRKFPWFKAYDRDGARVNLMAFLV